MAIKLVIDTASDLLQGEIAEDFVVCLPIKVRFLDEEFIDGVNISRDEFYDRLVAAKELPKTTQVNSFEFGEVFGRIVEAGDEVLGVFMSGELSGTFSSAQTAKTALGADKSDRIALVDSKTGTIPYRALVDVAIDMIKAGATLVEIKERLEELREKVVLLAVVSDLTYLRKGGRFNAAVALIASTLRINPILSTQNGKIVVRGKAFGFKKACAGVARIVSDCEVDTDLPCYLSHAQNPEMLQRLEEELLAKTPLKNFIHGRVGLSIGTHTGPQAAGVAFFIK